MYMGVYGGVGVIEAIIEVLREMILLLSCTSAGRGINFNEVNIIHEVIVNVQRYLGLTASFHFQPYISNFFIA